MSGPLSWRTAGWQSTCGSCVLLVKGVAGLGPLPFVQLELCDALKQLLVSAVDLSGSAWFRQGSGGGVAGAVARDAAELDEWVRAFSEVVGELGA